MTTAGVIFDVDGVLLDDGQPIPGASEALERLRQHAIPFAFLTNSTQKARSELLAALRLIDPQAKDEDLITPADVARRWLEDAGYSAWALVPDVIAREFERLPGVNGEAVVVGDIGEQFNYRRMNDAFQRLQAGAPILALGKTRFFQRDGKRQLDSGPFVHALEYAANTQAIICGKPDARVFETAIHRLGVAPAACCMIGDDVVSDVQAALDAGLEAILVRTGKYRPGDEQAHPGLVVADDVLAAVASLLLTNKV